MSIMKLLQSILVIICLTSCLAAVPRVREKRDFPRQFDIGDVVDTIPSASSIVKSLDDISLSLVNRFSSTVSSLTPVLTVTALTYFAYVASVLFFPGALSRMGIPVLEEMSAKSSNVPRPTPKFIDSLANDFVKDLFGKSNAAEAMKQTAREVVADSVFVVRTVTKMVSTELKKAQETVRDVSDALSPGCIARYMCRAGQFTSVHLPTLGAVLRNFSSPRMDDYAEALIRGTTIGDCNAIFNQCEL